ncbi:ARF GTPase-activating protein GIT1-like isoform X4 [Sinocyclocheilus anshuiensis]|uniref:ARF GTPase-activating protein GIT1-like isoform X1 n=1 Tax=Sinocyclocheilus anshuiensis TaxID=1608454 RepID=UPI0007B7B21B|nr:PREDICTED: ARF GTPase-activating protein GIT1-like isoform X1 [Sinocyclocheilus anshuiensis]XP_016317599.1 PREDICTED: ARF GTPase-activating protein GIT1-like isoform X4 [Sinocyclocheilus anshuiensis]
MSRKVQRSEVCADCSAPDPGWSSINRGVLICDECCSVHRSLGRHISIVKHLRHSGWPPSLLQMVQTLASNGANSIWEHSLLDPAQVQSGRRKPNPQDKVHPTKSEFIRAKYQMLAFVHKLPCRDDDGVTTKDLSKQLHSSVRTGSLETCLRLLSLGAQANFFHPEKGTTPLHVAAKAGQVLQAELLVVYGADPGAPDINGRTPIDYARQAGHVELAERLVECQYELTDRLAFYLCGRRPDHKNGHYIIPQMADRARPKCPTQSLDLSELAKAAKKKLQALNNHLFEELAMDVYDEVDRRENDAVWLTTQNHSTLVTERSAVPFLPVNPEYSATRNQGRQKLARFNAREFATLIIDILSDAKRRQHGKGLTSPTDPLDLSQEDDDQHDYDSVASDEDTDSELTAQNNNNTQRNNRAKSMDSSDLSDGPITLQEYLEVKKALASSEAKVQQLMKVNNNLSEELRRLQKEITRMQTENRALRGAQAGARGSLTGGGGSGLWLGGVRGTGGGVGGDSSLNTPSSAPLRRDRQAFSMYEPVGTTPKALTPALDPLTGRLQPLSPVRKGAPMGPTPYGGPHLSASTDGRYNPPKAGEKYWSGPDSDYDNSQTYDVSLGVGRSSEEDSRGDVEDTEGEPDPTLPCTEDVILKTEQVTKNIQELLRAAQEFKHDSFVPCSEKIHLAVTEMASLFPKRPALDAVRSSLKLLAASASRLQVECRKAAPSDSSASTVDYQLLTQQVIQCAYDIAKAAKQLVTITTREKKQ